MNPSPPVLAAAGVAPQPQSPPQPQARQAPHPVPELSTQVVVIGAGPAGVAAAEGVAAAAAGPQDALEAARRGGLRLVLVDDAPAGDGGWSGRLAVAALVEVAARRPDWPAARDQVRAARKGIVARHQARIEALQARLGPQGLILVGRARLAGAGQVFVQPRGGDASAGPHRVRARRIVLATGCVPALPEVSGLTETAYLTPDRLPELTELDRPPYTVVVLGAGSTGCAIAQALARLGVSVTLVDEHQRVLAGEDRQAAAVVADALVRDGVRLLLGSPVVKVAPTLDGGAWLGTAAGVDVAAERLVVATGWRAGTGGLDLPLAGVEVGAHGAVRVDAALVTSASEVLAAGGVVAGEPHAGASLAMGAVAGANAVAKRPSATWSGAAVATLTLTDPEVASVGSCDPEADGVGSGTVRWGEIDRAVLAGAGEGFVRVLVAMGASGGRWTSRRTTAPAARVVGATVVGCRAGDLVMPLALAIGAGLPAHTLAAAVSADPTWSSALRLAVLRACAAPADPGGRRSGSLLVGDAS